MGVEYLTLVLTQILKAPMELAMKAFGGFQVEQGVCNGIAYNRNIDGKRPFLVNEPTREKAHGFIALCICDSD